MLTTMPQKYSSDNAWSNTITNNLAEYSNRPSIYIQQVYISKCRIWHCQTLAYDTAFQHEHMSIENKFIYKWRKRNTYKNTMITLRMILKTL